jgi:hypothetical protein
MRRQLALVLVAAAVSARFAAAHTTPAVLGVISDAGGELGAVRLAHGLAARDEQGRFRFICPHTWGGPDTPLALALGGTAAPIVVIGAQRAFELGARGEATPATSAIDTATAKKLVRGGGFVFALAGDRDSSLVLRFEPGRATPVIEDRSTIHSIAATRARLYTVAPAAEGAALGEHALDGAELGDTIARGPDLRDATLRLGSAGDRLYLTAARAGETRLFRVDDGALAELATSTTAVLGPVRAGGEDVVLEGGALRRAGGAVIDAARAYTCLDEGEAGAYACARTVLYALEPGGAAGAAVFDVAEVKGPRLAGLDEDARLACELEWRDFALEAGLDPAIPAEEPASSAPGEGCGCTAGGRPSVIGLALLFLWQRRRSRRR